MVFDFIVGQSIVLVEEAEDDSLVTVDHEDVLLLGECGLELSLSMMEEPCEVSVAVFVFVELLEFRSALFHFRRKGACTSVLFRPMSIGEDFSGELYSVDDSIGVLLLKC